MLKSFGRYAGRAVPAALALVLVGGFAHATIPDNAGMIHGCYAKKGGALKVIDTDRGQHCTTKQAPLNWQGGSNIVARIRWTGSVNLPTGSNASVPLGVIGSWTQGPNEIDTVVPGTVTVSSNAGCQVDDVGIKVQMSDYPTFEIAAPSNQTPFSQIGNPSPMTGTLILIPGGEESATPLMPFESATATTRQLTATVLDPSAECSGPDSVGGHMTAFSFDITATR